MQWDKLKDWLCFSGKERTAALVLAGLIGLFFVVPRIFRSAPGEKTASSFEARMAVAPNGENSGAAAKKTLFLFDPNTLNATGWRALGLREKTIQTILHYREKGGYFKSPEDIRKIYGLKKADADRLIPYISIETRPSVTTGHVVMPKAPEKKYAFPLEVNKAGIEHWAQLPGVSRPLATRIVHYRDAMQGFRSLDQIGKTYGMTPQLLQRIRPYLRMTEESVVSMPSRLVVADSLTEQKAVLERHRPAASPVNINTASEQELLATGHISRNVAKAIIIYRDRHGHFNSVADVKKIVFITPEMYEKLLPYLAVE